MLEALNASTNLTVKDNVFFSSFTSVGTSSGTLLVDGTSNATFAADYNDYFSSNAFLTFQWGAPRRAALWPPGRPRRPGQDAQSIPGGPVLGRVRARGWRTSTR